MSFLKEGNNSSFEGEKHVINVVEVNDLLINFFEDNINNLFNIKKMYIKEDIKMKIFNKDIKISNEDLSEILTQLYLIDSGYEYITYSYNIESPKEKAKNFDGIFTKNDEIYYLEVKTKLETDSKNFIKDTNDKIKEATNDVLKTKIYDNEQYNKLYNYSEAHFSSKSRNFNFSKSIDSLLEEISYDLKKEEFNIISSGACVIKDKNLNLNKEFIEEPKKNVKIKKNILIGILNGVGEEFSEKIKEKYEI